MENVILYGAGVICAKTLPFIASKYNVTAIADSDPKRIGREIYGIPIIGLSDVTDGCKIIITANDSNIESIKKTLASAGLEEYTSYHDVINIADIEKRERIISYSDDDQLEDVILYNVFEDYDDIFYIDVGSNDPMLSSVTKLFYDTKNAHGINIEPLQKPFELTVRERRRDINLCVALGAEEGHINLFVQGGASTVIEANVIGECEGKITVPMTTLAKICEEYTTPDQLIHFLKIDVEGFERDVLLGADWKKYRPMVIVMEATLPFTNTPCHDRWEDVLTDNAYHFAFSYGVNRYYVADEYSYLDDRFVPVLQIMSKYRVFHIR